MARSLKKRNGIVEKLDRFLMKMKTNGELFLPPERKLCAVMGCSRETLRRAIEHQESAGTILKKGRARILSAKMRGDEERLGRFAFVANGQGMVGNPAWNKLWHALSTKAKRENISAELILLPYKSEMEEIRSLFEASPKILIIATIDDDNVRDFIFALEEKTLITTEEHYRDRVANLITLDNYEAGRLAAKKLSDHGYEKPAMITNIHYLPGNAAYIPFIRRKEGFKAGCGEFGMSFSRASDITLTSTNSVNRIYQLIKSASIVANGDFDSVFLYSDDDLPFFYEALSDEKSIPGEIGLITLNSFDIALSHDPPISACSHGTDPVADTLIAGVKRIFTEGQHNIGHVFVKPDFHEGGTLK